MRSHVVVAAALAAGIALTACSGSSPEPGPTPSDSAVGGMATCDQATISAAVESDVNATYPGATFVSLDDFTCVEGWASATAQVDTSGTTVPTEFFLRAEGQFWIPTSIEDICSMPLAESDAPEEIYVAACGVQQ
ncbi:MAG: hypothetical protein ACKOFP_00325 [Actinomycetota bacterium]